MYRFLWLVAFFLDTSFANDSHEAITETVNNLILENSDREKSQSLDLEKLILEDARVLRVVLEKTSNVDSDFIVNFYICKINETVIWEVDSSSCQIDPELEKISYNDLKFGNTDNIIEFYKYARIKKLNSALLNLSGVIATVSTLPAITVGFSLIRFFGFVSISGLAIGFSATGEENFDLLNPHDIPVKIFMAEQDFDSNQWQQGTVNNIDFYFQDSVELKNSIKRFIKVAQLNRQFNHHKRIKALGPRGGRPVLVRN